MKWDFKPNHGVNSLTEPRQEEGYLIIIMCGVAKQQLQHYNSSKLVLYYYYYYLISQFNSLTNIQTFVLTLSIQKKCIGLLPQSKPMIVQYSYGKILLHLYCFSLSLFSVPSKQIKRHTTLLSQSLSSRVSLQRTIFLVSRHDDYIYNSIIGLCLGTYLYKHSRCENNTNQCTLAVISFRFCFQDLAQPCTSPLLLARNCYPSTV